MEGLNFLRTMNLAHTDLKPENILLIDDTVNVETGLPLHWDVKLIDFGNASYITENCRRLICTR
jgi:serine/threonine protein kinase